MKDRKNVIRGNAQKGFTLIELLVTVTIIAILMAIAIPGLLLAQGRARQKATVAEIRAYGNILGTYRVDHGQRLPNADGDFPKLHTVLTATYNTTLSEKDHWGFAYGYKVTGLQTYEFSSFGSDGIPGALFLKNSPRAAVFLDIVYSDGTFLSYVQS